MTKRSWAPSAAAVKQKDTLVFSGTWQAADTITLTIDNVTLLITVGAVTSAANVANLVYEAFTGATSFTDTTATMVPQGGGTSIAQMNEIDVSISSATLTFTSKTAGVPFTMTASRSTGASGAISYTAEVVAASGNTFFSQQDNWTANTVPVDAVDITFEQSDIDCSDGLSPAIQPGEFQHWMSYTGYIGRTQRNTKAPSAPYSDYRTRALTFDDNGGATGTYKLGLGSGLGARGIRLNFGAGLSLVTVYKSKAAANNVPNILLQGTNSNNTLANLDGSVGVSFYAGEAMTLVALTNGQGEQSNAQTICGPDATLTSCVVNVISGRVETNSAVLTVNTENLAAEYVHNKGNITNLNGYAGTIKLNAALTVTAGYIDCRLDLSGTSGTVTFTDVEFGPNADVYAPAGNIAFTNPYTQGAYSPKRKLNLGPNRSFAVT
jgi:hypothetical protein